MGIREDLFSILVKKTKELDRQVTASDMLKDKEKDESIPDPNDYGWYYGKFDDAAKQAYIEGTPWPQAERKVDVMRRIRPCPLSKEKQQTVISEMVDMFIQNDGMMPTNKQIKKNRLISEKDVDDMRWAGLIYEPDIRKLAEEKSGRKFLSPTERKRQNIQAIAVEVSSTTPKEVEKVEEVKEVNEAVEVKEVPVTNEAVGVKETPTVETAGTTEKAAETKARAPKSKKEPKAKRRYQVKTDDELWAEMRAKCYANGRVLSDAEISADEELSSPQTYYNHLGSEYKRMISLELLRRISEPKPEPASEPEPEPQPEPKLEVIQEEQPTLDPEPVVSGEERIIPIKVIVPKGIKGTINLTLEF